MASDGERRRGETRSTNKEAASVHVGCAVATRAVAVERPDRDVVTRARDDRYVEERIRHRRTMTAQAASYVLVHPSDGVDREVTGRGMALRTRRSRRNVTRSEERRVG